MVVPMEPAAGRDFDNSLCFVVEMSESLARKKAQARHCTTPLSLSLKSSQILTECLIQV